MGKREGAGQPFPPHSSIRKTMTAKNKLPRMVPNTAAQNFTARESWRIFGIMAEFVEATERLKPIRPAVSIFGSARTKPDHPYYAQTEKIARLLSDASR